MTINRVDATSLTTTGVAMDTAVGRIKLPGGRGVIVGDGGNGVRDGVKDGTRVGVAELCVAMGDGVRVALALAEGVKVGSNLVV